MIEVNISKAVGEVNASAGPYGAAVAVSRVPRDGGVLDPYFLVCKVVVESLDEQAATVVVGTIGANRAAVNERHDDFIEEESAAVTISGVIVVDGAVANLQCSTEYVVGEVGDVATAAGRVDTTAVVGRVAADRAELDIEVRIICVDSAAIVVSCIVVDR